MEPCKGRHSDVIAEACGGKNRNIMKRVIIIGGGASGLAAAIAAARCGSKVTVLEHQNQVGKKILVTGNGRCNFTNMDQSIEHYHGGNRDFIETALSCFDVKQTIRFFEELGIYPKNRNGYLYPHSDAASSVLEVLRMECEHLRVKIACQITVESVEKTDSTFKVHTSGWTYEAEKLILAAGSKAAPATGSDGSGYELAKVFSHRIISPYPALVQLLSRERYLHTLAGVRTDAGVTLFADGEKIAENRGELQINAGNLSGIPVFQISAEAARALAENRNCVVIVDFLPDMTQEVLMDFIKRRIVGNEYKSVVQFLTGLFPKKLSEVMNKAVGFSKSAKAGNFTEDDIIKLCKQIKEFKFSVYAANGFESAQCCSGGVDVNEIDPKTMASKLCENLYICGELLDVNGDCGGYNLQWAWTSGYLAGANGND
ncbi:MAG: NAD(P)/FAD-dependent oxidoreductase [Lachnospiraceae bacterium]